MVKVDIDSVSHSCIQSQREAGKERGGQADIVVVVRDVR